MLFWDRNQRCLQTTFRPASISISQNINIIVVHRMTKITGTQSKTKGGGSGVLSVSIINPAGKNLCKINYCTHLRGSILHVLSRFSSEHEADVECETRAMVNWSASWSPEKRERKHLYCRPSSLLSCLINIIQPFWLIGTSWHRQFPSLNKMSFITGNFK